MMGVPLWTRERVAERILAGDNLIVYRGDVLLIPPSWLAAHPGGALAILHFVGRDATDEVEAFHSEAALKRVRAFNVGRLADSDQIWNPFVPPVMSGWVRRTGADGLLAWHREANTIRLEKDTDAALSSEILLVHQSVPEKSKGPTMATIAQPPSNLSLKNQAEHSAHYKKLHKRVIDAGLYETPYLTGYGPEFGRYILLATLAVLAYRHGWLMTSAVFLGLFWHQIMFFVHDLGHMGVTHNWTLDRTVAVFLADYLGGLSVGWWVDNHNIHHLVTNHPSHDPDIEHLPFFAITTAFFKSLYSSYYKRVLPFDAASRLFVSLQHRLFYVVMSLARFNLYANSYGFLARRAFAPKLAPRLRKAYAFEVAGIAVFWAWFGCVLRGCGSWQKALGYLLISHVVTSPIHLQIVLSHFSRSTADLGVSESFPHRQLRTTTDVLCHPSLAFVHGGLHLQVTHHLFPRLPRHNLARASLLVKEFAKEEGLEYHEFGFVEGNLEVKGVMKGVADQVKIMGMVAREEVREAVEKKVQ